VQTAHDKLQNTNATDWQKIEPCDGPPGQSNGRKAAPMRYEYWERHTPKPTNPNSTIDGSSPVSGTKNKLKQLSAQVEFP
jgi:hypothetical protein